MTATLSPELSALVKRKVASGRYSDSEAVLSRALEMLEARDNQERLRTAIVIGEVQDERGEAESRKPEVDDCR